MSEYRFDRIKQSAYLAHLRDGRRRGEAADAVGVTRQAIYAYCQKNPEFKELVSQAEVDACDKVENVLYEKALAGHFGAIIFWLLNRSGGRWLDKRQPPVISQTTVQAEQSPKEIAAELKKMLDKGKRGTKGAE